MAADETFPWRRAIALGLGILRLPPAVFWSMTLSELDGAVQGALGLPEDATPPSRAQLDALMRRFPDMDHESEDYGRF